MQFESVKHIAQYYKAIPGMLRLLQQEREELEGNYYGLRGLAYDGTPHSSSPGKPTEEAGLRALESGVGDRLAEIKANEMVLSADAAAIRGCLDAVNGRYKQVILMRYVRGYSWAKTGVRMNAPDSTVRNWHERAMERFGEALEELPGAAELAARDYTEKDLNDLIVGAVAKLDTPRKPRAEARELDRQYFCGITEAMKAADRKALCAVDAALLKEQAAGLADAMAAGVKVAFGSKDAVEAAGTLFDRVETL